ncbi:hypothetical protein MAP00_003224 [Monascus purpureus]|nr:hypothetical protein MAP00_003224 [Monascus purpureus]
MVVPRTPPTTARRHRRQPESTDPSSDIGSSASSVISEEMDTPTAPRAQSSTTANTMASTPDITALFQQMQEQMQEQMQKQMDQFMTRFNTLERRQSQSSTPTYKKILLIMYKLKLKRSYQTDAESHCLMIITTPGVQPFKEKPMS